MLGELTSRCRRMRVFSHRDGRGRRIARAARRRRAPPRRRPLWIRADARGTRSRVRTASPARRRSVWDVEGSGDTDIQGFATNISVNVGQTENFKIETTARGLLDHDLPDGLLRRRRCATDRDGDPVCPAPQTQPPCITDQTTYLYDCGNWGVSASWNVPSSAVSGVYMAHLTRTDNGDESQIIFIVRNDSSHSDIVFQTSDATWQAYNTYGGSDFYTGGGDNGRAYQISYNRPVDTRDVARWPGLLLLQRVPARASSSSRTGTTSAISRVSTPTGPAACCSTTRSSCPSVTTSTGARRSARTS